MTRLLALAVACAVVAWAAASTTPFAGLQKPNPNPNKTLSVANSSKLFPAAATIDALRAELTAPIAGAKLSGAVKDVGGLFIEPDAGYGPVLDFIASATTTLDYWIYQLGDEKLEAALVAAAARGVKVRVILSWQTFAANSDLYDPSSSSFCKLKEDRTCPVACNGVCGSYIFNANEVTANVLRAGGVAAQMSPFWYTYSHAKSMIADGHVPGKGRLLIMDFNGQNSYFTKTRGFGVVSTDPLDVAEAQSVFDSDWKYEFPLTYKSGRLFWAPNGVGYVPPSDGTNKVLGLVASARVSLDVYGMLIDWPVFADALVAAKERGVSVRILTNCWSSSTPPFPPDCSKRPVGGFTHKYLTQFLAAGIAIRQGPDGGTLFLHTKTLIRDAGVGGGGALATISSENPGDYVSMNAERELGIILAKDDLVATIAATFNKDWDAATPVTA